MISLIIPTYNRVNLLKETIESIRKQTYQKWECIVVDDGSKDDTEAYMTEMAGKDTRIRYYKRNSNLRGAPVCRNEGIEYAQGDFLMFVDSDDLLAPYCLEKRKEAVEKYPEHDFWVFPVLVFHKTPGDLNLLWNARDEREDLLRLLIPDVPWHTSSPLWRRETVEKLGGWDERLPSWQDWEYHLRAIVTGLSYKWVKTLPDFFYRKDEHSAISKSNADESHLEARERLFERTYKLLKKHKLLNASRKEAFAHAHLRIAHHWTRTGHYDNGLRIWKRAHELGLSNTRLFRQGKQYLWLLNLQAEGIPLITKLAHRIYLQFYIKPLRKEFPRTMLNKTLCQPKVNAVRERLQDAQTLMTEDFS